MVEGPEQNQTRAGMGSLRACNKNSSSYQTSLLAVPQGVRAMIKPRRGERRISRTPRRLFPIPGILDAVSPSQSNCDRPHDCFYVAVICLVVAKFGVQLGIVQMVQTVGESSAIVIPARVFRE